MILSLLRILDSDRMSCELEIVYDTFFSMMRDSGLLESKERNMIAYSSPEVDYEQQLWLTGKLLWPMSPLSSLGIHLGQSCSSIVTIKQMHITVNHVFHERMEHIKINNHVLLEYKLSKAIVTRTMLPLADVFHKSIWHDSVHFSSHPVRHS